MWTRMLRRRIDYIHRTRLAALPNAGWRAAVAPLLDARAAFAISGKTLRVAIPLPESVGLADPYVFIANKQLVSYSAAQTFRRKGDLLIAEIPLDEFGTGKAEALSGILADQAQSVRDAYAPWFDLSPTRQRGDWVRVDGVRKADR
jgi:hypothetical protein